MNVNNRINIDLNIDSNQSSSNLKNINTELQRLKKISSNTIISIKKATLSLNDFQKTIVAIYNFTNDFLGKIIQEAYHNSKDFQEQFELLKYNLSNITAEPFKKIGDTIAKIVQSLNEWFNIQNSISGVAINNLHAEYQALLDKNKAIEQAQMRQIEIMKISKTPLDEIQRAELELLRIKERSAQEEYKQSGIFEVERKKQLKIIDEQIKKQEQLIENAKNDDGSSFMYGISQADAIKNLEKELIVLNKKREEIENAINVAKSIESDAEQNLIQKTKNRVALQTQLNKKTEEIKDKTKKIHDEAMLKVVNKAYDWMNVISQVHSISQGIASLSLSSKLIDTTIYDKAINEVKAKITEFNKWKAEQEEEEADKQDAEYEAYLERLNKEYEIAKEIGDKMTMLAIENKKKQLDKEKEALEKEKQITAQEKALEKELAIAEYNKAYAEWQNECMIAEQTKNMNLAQAIIQPLQASAYAALGIARDFATSGVVGAALASASAIGIISSAVSTASAYKNSASQLDSVKASPPEPPAFRFGTAGYQLENGESAIVGEAGAEIIKNMAGKLVVETNAQAKQSGKLDGYGMYVETVIFNVNSIVDKNTIFKAMNEYKERNSFVYTR